MAHLADLLEPALYTLTNAVLAWAVLFILVVFLLALEIVSPRINLVCIARSLGPLGIFPYFLFIYVLIELFPQETEVGTFSVYLPQIVCSVLAAAFSTIYAASIRHAARDTRIQDLVSMASANRFSGRIRILAPLSIPSFIVAMKTGWPLIVLMTLLFEWGRGDLSGLGAPLQGSLMTGTWSDIAWVVGFISLISCSLYYVLEGLDYYVRRRLQIDSVDFFASEPAAFSFRRQRNAYSCLAAAVALFLITWEMTFFYSPVPDTHRYDPWRFITELVSPTARLGGEVMSGPFASAVWNSLALALVASLVGPIAAVFCALIADRSITFRCMMSVLTHISQAVPIFVFIPALYAAFRDTTAVAILILASATYFRAYEYIRGELANSFGGWKELMTLAGTPINLMARVVRFYRVEMRIVWSAAVRGAALVFPYSITAAVVADLFLNLSGLGRLASFEARGDIPMTLAACLAMLLIGMSGDALASWLAQNRSVNS